MSYCGHYDITFFSNAAESGGEFRLWTGIQRLRRFDVRTSIDVGVYQALTMRSVKRHECRGPSALRALFCAFGEQVRVMANDVADGGAKALPGILRAGRKNPFGRAGLTVPFLVRNPLALASSRKFLRTHDR
jgi:hypothetical protein